MNSTDWTQLFGREEKGSNVGEQLGGGSESSPSDLSVLCTGTDLGSMVGSTIMIFPFWCVLS